MNGFTQILILQAMLGVRGSVKDEATEEMLEGVEFQVVGIDKTMSTDSNGYYWRLLTPGNYTIRFSKEGLV